jgi:hypothetical protein
VKRLLASLAAAALAVAGTAFAAAAANADVVGTNAAFRLRGSHGYSIQVLGYSKRADGRGSVLILVGTGRSGATYLAPANVTDSHVESDLGKLGRISVQFVPTGAVEQESSPCGDDYVQFEAGAYQGTIEFRGEEDYTAASATRVRAEIKPFLGLVCFGHGEGETIGSGLPGAGLKVRSASRDLVLKVNKNRPGARVTYRAELRERRDKIGIVRSVEGAARSGAFVFSHGLSTAILDPPMPFSGAASFHRNAAVPNRWTGSLAIDFPGRSHVPLTGPGLKATLVPARHTVDPRLAT